MRTSICRSGNRLAVRIPKHVADVAHWEQDVPVALTVMAGRVIVEPVSVRHYTLAELLAGVTDDSCHAEWQIGPAAGREAW